MFRFKNGKHPKRNTSLAAATPAELPSPTAVTARTSIGSSTGIRGFIEFRRFASLGLGRAIAPLSAACLIRSSHQRGSTKRSPYLNHQRLDDSRRRTPPLLN